MRRRKRQTLIRNLVDFALKPLKRDAAVKRAIAPPLSAVASSNPTAGVPREGMVDFLADLGLATRSFERVPERVERFSRMIDNIGAKITPEPFRPGFDLGADRWCKLRPKRGVGAL